MLYSLSLTRISHWGELTRYLWFYFVRPTVSLTLDVTVDAFWWVNCSIFHRVDDPRIVYVRVKLESLRTESDRIHRRFSKTKHHLCDANCICIFNSSATRYFRVPKTFLELTANEENEKQNKQSTSTWSGVLSSDERKTFWMNSMCLTSNVVGSCYSSNCIMRSGDTTRDTHSNS